MTTLTMAEYLEIYEECEAWISDRDAEEELQRCNELAEAGERIQGKWVATASDWARFYAEQNAAEQNADAQAYAKFHYDAYGD